MTCNSWAPWMSAVFKKQRLMFAKLCKPKPGARKTHILLAKWRCNRCTCEFEYLKHKNCRSTVRLNKNFNTMIYIGHHRSNGISYGQLVVDGHFSYLNWRYPPYKAYISYPTNMALCATVPPLGDSEIPIDCSVQGSQMPVLAGSFCSSSILK